MSDTLIPSPATRLQQDLARLTEAQAAAIDADIIRRSRDPEKCDAQWLPWLAWERSIGDEEGWAFADTEAVQRQLITDFVKKHQYKGTHFVIRKLFADIGLGEIKIIEKGEEMRKSGIIMPDSNTAVDWARYAIEVRTPITNLQAAIIRRMLEAIAPKRCELVYLDFRGNPLYWDGEINFDGQYNFGAA